MYLVSQNIVIWIFVPSVGVNDRVQNLEDILQKLHEFNDLLSDVNSNLKKYEDKLQAHNDLGPAGKDAKHLDKMRVHELLKSLMSFFVVFFFKARFTHLWLVLC